MITNKILYGLLLISTSAFAQHIELEENYTDYDKHKAVTTCMQHIYLEKYQNIPADEDVFPLCEQRFLLLSRTLSHKDFLEEKSKNIQYNADKPTPSTGNIYYDILFGYPAETY